MLLKAEEHFNNAIQVEKEIGAKSWLGLAYLYLGFLHRAKHRSDEARDCFIESIEILVVLQDQMKIISHLRRFDI